MSAAPRGDRKDSTRPLLQVMLSSNAPTEEIVVLVHGTRLPHVGNRKKFAEDIPWTAPNSVFRARLAPYLKGVLVDDEFRWSGGNSHTARLQAGQELAAHLRKMNACYQFARIVILAHSHGGVVALYAMRELGEAPYVAKLIFMNTPFLECKRRDLGRFAKIIALAIMGTWFGAEILLMGSPKSGIVTVAGVGAWVIAILAGAVLKTRLPKIQEYLYQRIRLRMPSTQLVNINCNDEVGFWLGIVHYLSNLPFRIWLFVGRWGLTFVLLCFALSMLSALATIPIFIAHQGSVDDHSMLGAVANLLLLIWGDIAALIPILAGVTGVFAIVFIFVLVSLLRAIHGNRFAFGDDLTQNLLLDISARREPSTPNMSCYTSWRYSGATIGQKHFAYSYPPAIDFIRDCLTASCAQEKVGGQNDPEDSGQSLPEMPEKLSWRSILADLKAGTEPGVTPHRVTSQWSRVVSRGLAIVVLALFALSVISEIKGWVISRNNAAAAKNAGFPENATYQSEVVLAPNSLKQIANVLSGYQRYLESIGHPPNWRKVEVAVVPSLERPASDAAPSHAEWTPSAIPPILRLNGSSLPGRSELVEAYGEVLFSPSQSVSSAADNTPQALAEAFIQYSCFSYVGSLCASMAPLQTWPQGPIDFGKSFPAAFALAQALIEIRGEAGGDLTDPAVMRAFLSTETEKLPDERRFVERVLQQLGSNAIPLNAHFVRHGIPTPQK